MNERGDSGIHLLSDIGMMVNITDHDRNLAGMERD